MKKILIILGLIVVGLASYQFWFQQSLTARRPDDESRYPFTIEAGQTVAVVAQNLKDAGIIRSPYVFRRYVVKNNLDTTIQAGRFVLRASQSVPELVEVLQSGRGEEVIVTIPEGYTVSDIDALLTEKELISSGEFAECARTCDFSRFEFLPDASSHAPRGGQVEGYLYPDTYFVVVDRFDAESFLQRLLATFQAKIVDGYRDDIATSGRSLADIVTMASLVEEESGSADESPVIAGILWKRLDNGVGLGVDATVRYILNKPTDAITVNDLQSDSPYNTRRYRGLPPGPIANPGLTSILATLNPEDSPYWYYLHGTDGQIRYAETNDGHNENKQRYL